MSIESRNLEPGTRLVANYKKETYYALVIAGEDGKVRYTLTPSDGTEYKSPSSLGTAVTGKACNGWAFWSVDNAAATEEAETAGPGETEAPTSEAEEPEEPTYVPVGEESTDPAPTGSFRRVANQRGVDEGQVRLYCESCKSSFIVPEDQNPENCPMGHQPN